MRITDHTPLRIAGALATCAAAALLTTAPAEAAGKTSAACTNHFVATISPGFSPIATAGTQTTNGQTGSIACVGRIAGHRVTGIGTIGFDATYSGGTCASETATGTVRATIPTTGGPQHLVGALTVRRTALSISATVRFNHGIRYRGVGTPIPVQGNCAMTPLQQAVIVLTGTLSS